MKRFLTALVVFLCLKSSAYGVPLNSISAENHVQLITHTSQYARVVGRVESAEITDNSKVIFLNFGKNFNTSLSAVIYNPDVPAFINVGINEPEKFYRNKNVVVEGIIRVSNGKPEIIINSPSQIKILNEE